MFTLTDKLDQRAGSRGADIVDKCFLGEVFGNMIKDERAGGSCDQILSLGGVKLVPKAEAGFVKR